MIYRFSRFLLDDQAKAIMADETRVEMEKRAILLLVHLVRNRRRIVSKEELLDLLWGGDSISESSLPRCMSMLRSSLERHDPDANKLIETVYGRGYRFSASVEIELEGLDSWTMANSARLERLERIESLREQLDQDSPAGKGIAEKSLFLATLEARQGKFDQARARLLKILVRAKERCEANLYARAAIVLARTYLATHANDLLVAVLGESIRMIGSSDPVLSLELRAEFQVARIPFSTVSDRRGAVMRNLRESRSLGKQCLDARMLFLGHRALEGPDFASDRRHMATRALELARASGQRDLLLGAHAAGLSDALLAGDLEEFLDHLVEMESVARDVEESIWTARCMVARSALSYLHGDYDAALEYRDRALIVMAESSEDFRLLACANGFMIARENPDDLYRVIADLGIESHRDPLSTIAFELGRLYLGPIDDERVPSTADLLERIGSIDRNLIWSSTIAFFAEVAYLRGDKRLAERVVDEICRASGPMVATSGYFCIEPFDYFLGLSHVTLGAWEAVAHAFASATEQCRALEAPGFEARVASAWGSMLLRSGRTEWKQIAREKLEFAYENAVALGLGRLQRDSMDQLAKLSDPKS